MGYLTHQLEKLASAVEDSAKEKLDTLKAIGGGAAGAATGALGTGTLASILENAKLRAVFNSKPYQRLAQKEVNLINQLSPLHRYYDPELSAKNLLKLDPGAMRNEIKVMAALDKLRRVKSKMEAKGKLGTMAKLGLTGLGLASSAGLGALGANMATSD
jgi:hypothetical protein